MFMMTWLYDVYGNEMNFKVYFCQLSVSFNSDYSLRSYFHNTGCSIRVETLGNFEGKSRLPRQNSGTLEKLPRKNSGQFFKHMFKDFPEDFLSIGLDTIENLYT